MLCADRRTDSIVLKVYSTVYLGSGQVSELDSRLCFKQIVRILTLGQGIKALTSWGGYANIMKEGFIMKLRKRIAAIGAAVMMAACTISANAVSWTPAGASIKINNCRTSSYFRNPKGSSLFGLLDGEYIEDYVYLKTIRYEGNRVGELNGRLYYNVFSTDYVKSQTSGSKYKTYAWVDTDIDFTTSVLAKGSFTTGKCPLKGDNGDKGSAEFGGVVRVT